jgi:hypothetical protein
MSKGYFSNTLVDFHLSHLLHQGRPGVYAGGAQRPADDAAGCQHADGPRRIPRAGDAPRHRLAHGKE